MLSMCVLIKKKLVKCTSATDSEMQKVAFFKYKKRLKYFSRFHMILNLSVFSRNSALENFNPSNNSELTICLRYV